MAPARTWTTRRTGRWRRLFTALILLLAALSAAYYVWQHPGWLEAATAFLSRSVSHDNAGPRGGGDVQTAIPVHATAVKRGDFPVLLSGLGTAQAWNSVVVRSRVDGQVEKISFEEGQSVKAGDVLVELDARPFQASLDQATAKIAQDQANLTSAEADLARTKTLVTPGFATKQLFDQQTAAVNQLRALIKADEAAQESAKVNLGYTTIRAPISGRLGLRTIDTGNIVHATDQNGVVTIAEIQPIAVVFTAPEGQLPAITRGLKGGELDVVAFSSDGKTKLGSGKLGIINNDIDVASGTIRLKGRFENPDDLLWPGLSVTTQLRVTTLRDQVIMPDIAVQRGLDGLFAYLVRADGTVEKRNLKVDQIGNGIAVVESGVKPGDQVITAGQARLQPGARVAVTANDNAKAAGD